MRDRSGARILVPAVAFVVVVAACSSGDDGSSGESATASTTTVAPVEQRGEQVASPEVTGPVTGGEGGAPFLAMADDIAEEYDYIEEEFFLDGEADAYEVEGVAGPDGRWSVSEAGTAPYRTRILVRRPADADAFDGTVFVEWFNVTGGIDNDPGFGLGHPALADRGSAYVGVSAQAVGVEGGGPSIEIEGVDDVPALTEWDPERYGDLDHPGDEYAYDIYSQAAQVVRRPGAVDVLGGLPARQVIAIGQSQSAGRLVTYVDAVHPVADIYDGFLIHSRSASGAPLSPDSGVFGDDVAQIRDDLEDPVLQFQTETDVPRYAAARQDDTETLRTWEVAGTAHADQSILDYNAALAGDFDFDMSAQCPVINDGPMAEVLRAGLQAIRTWVVDGEPAPAAPRLEEAGGSIARDELGIALGGIRTPPVDAPALVLSGQPQEGTSIICSLFGDMTPIPPAELARLYPTHQDYVDAVTASADAAVADGFLLPADAEAYVAEAETASVPD